MKINTNSILSIYENLCEVSSDINEHLPILKKYTENCNHVTEMGVRSIVSTWAFLAGNPNTLISYDINNNGLTILERIS